MQTTRKAEILDAFIRLVSRFGVDKTTIQDIAKEVGISVGVFYKDFSSKEELIEEYIDNMEQHFIEECLKVCKQDLPPEELLRCFIQGIGETFGKLVVESLGFCQFFQAQETHKVISKYFQKRKDFGHQLREMTGKIMERGVLTGDFVIDDIPKTANLFMKAFDSYWKDIFLTKNPEQVLQGINDMFNFLIRAIHK